MVTQNSLDKTAITHWLQDQQAAAIKMEEERTRFLLSLTKDKALAIYLVLFCSAMPLEAAKPSLLLHAMRRALQHKPTDVPS